MNTLKLLLPGYAKKLKNGWRANSAVVLIRTGKQNIIVDPGCHRQKLLAKLKQAGLAPAQITSVFLTHRHIDHTLLGGIFPQAKIIDREIIHDADRETEHRGFIPGTDLKIIKTPGHTADHASLLVPTKLGKYLVAGDLFWWQDGQQPSLSPTAPDPFATNRKQLAQSRCRALKLADWLIPGHGKTIKISV
ncbi:MAG: MBL fold metallo-hydrolase [Patescibacteria group bacterium]|jgi:glyoxylase-like metal-dependent hydrolase (beta-lactamase superfamily II)